MMPPSTPPCLPPRLSASPAPTTTLPAGSSTSTCASRSATPTWFALALLLATAASSTGRRFALSRFILRSLSSCRPRGCLPLLARACANTCAADNRLPHMRAHMVCPFGAHGGARRLGSDRRRSQRAYAENTPWPRCVVGLVHSPSLPLSLSPSLPPPRAHCRSPSARCSCRRA